MNYPDALILAESIKAKLKPFCQRIEIAGSVRRKKAYEIGDIEIVARPIMATVYQFREIVNNEWGRPSIGAYPSKYTRIRSNVNIDFFWPMSANHWGLIYFIRTGSEDYVIRALAHWKKITNGGYSQDGILHLPDGTVVPTLEESDVYAALKWPYREPEQRA